MNFNTTPAKFIHDSCDLLSELGPILYAPSKWITNMNRILNQTVIILDMNNSYMDLNGKWIARDFAYQDLLILENDINKTISLGLAILKQKPHFDKKIAHLDLGETSIREQCAKLQVKADKALSKYIEGMEHKNEVLLLLAAESDVNSPLNHIPKDLINLFATTMFEVELNDAKKACGAI